MKTTFIFQIFLSLLILGLPAQAEEYRIHWNVRANNIVHSSVCYDYPKGSSQYRGCRSKAKRYFTDKCNELTTTSRKVGRKETKQQLLERKKFCKAARTFNPIN